MDRVSSTFTFFFKLKMRAAWGEVTCPTGSQTTSSPMLGMHGKSFKIGRAKDNDLVLANEVRFSSF